jgi:hypothetical protein
MTTTTDRSRTNTFRYSVSSLVKIIKEQDDEKGDVLAASTYYTFNKYTANNFNQFAVMHRLWFACIPYKTLNEWNYLHHKIGKGINASSRSKGTVRAQTRNISV